MPIPIKADQKVAVDEDVEEEGAEEDARFVGWVEADLHGGDNAGVEQEHRGDTDTDCRRK